MPRPVSGSSPVASWRGDIFLLIAVNFMWALKWTLSKVALRQLDPPSITLFPMLGAMLLLVPLLLRKLKGQPAYFGVIRKETLTRANIFRFFLLGAGGQVACNVLVSWGLKYVPATDAAVIALGTPIFNAFLAALIVHEVLSWRLVPSFVCALFGVLLMTGIDFHGAGENSRWFYLFGVLLFFIGSIGSGFYNAYSKKLLDRFGPVEILFNSYIFVVLSLYVFNLAAGNPVSLHRFATLHWQTWLSLALLSIFVYGLSMILFLEVLTRRPLAPVAISIYLMTVFGVLISTTTLHEPITMRLAGGAVLVFLSTMFANAGKAKKKAVQP
jgi:drug/metabolite transporter (DMT)-like permease